MSAPLAEVERLNLEEGLELSLAASGRGEAVVAASDIFPELSWASIMAAVRIRSEYSSRERTAGDDDIDEEDSATGVDGPAVPGAENALLDDRECCRLCDPPKGDEKPGIGDDEVRDHVAKSRSLFFGVAGSIMAETSSSSLAMSGWSPP